MTESSRYHRAEASEDDNAASVLLALISLILGVLSFLARPRRGVVIEMRFPQCADCKTANGRPEAEHVSWEAHSLTFLVNRDFRRTVRRLQSAKN